MANTVIALKKSGTPSAVPGSLANGEIAINYADGKLFYKAANGTIASISTGSTVNDFGTVNAGGTLLVADTTGDVLDVRAGQNIIITGDAVNDRMTINADLTAANSWANTKLSNGSVTLAGSLTTTQSITSNGYLYILPSDGINEGGEIQLQGTGTYTSWSTDAYQNNYRVFARTGTSVSNVNFFHAVGGGSIRMGVNKSDPAYTVDVSGDVNITGTYRVNGTPISSGTTDLTPANNWANTVATAGNNYTNSVSAASNTWANSVSAASNAWANTLTTTDRAIANAAANSANAYTVTVGASANNWANNKLANTSGVSFAGDLYFPTGNIGVGSGSSAGYRLYVNGSFAANTKSFVIDHPTKPDMKLRHGSLEGPENGVYVRGIVQGKVIELPDYWIGLVNEETITVQLTAIGHSQNPYVIEVSNNNVFIDTENHTEPYCYFTIYGERKDVEKLVVEY